MESDPTRQDVPGGAATTIGRFAVEGQIGLGSAGSVYRAFDTKMRRDVAIKLLHPALAASPQARARFVDEARAASRVEHPGLCPIYEVDEVDGQPYLVMPYLRGETLAQRIEREVESGVTVADSGRVQAVTAIGERVATALEHLHSAGMVHCDVKPSNILIGSDGQPVVLDFGIARDLDSAARSRSGGAGTPLYMAPEQLSGRPDVVDGRTDVYGLGATLYEALTHEPPFGGASLFELYDRIRSQPTPDLRTSNPAVSRDLQAIVATATEKDPSRRYRTCGALAEDLGRLMRGEPIRARPTSRLTRAARWVRRNRAASTAAICLVTALVTATGMLWHNVGLSRDLDDRASSVSSYRETAESLRELASERLARFDLLAIVPKLEGARRSFAAAEPPWGGKVEALRALQQRIDTELRPRLAEVEAALQRLRAAASAEVLPAEDQVSERWLGLFEALEKRLGFLRAAGRVRRGIEEFAAEPVPVPDGGQLDLLAERLGSTAFAATNPESGLGVNADPARVVAHAEAYLAAVAEPDPWFVAAHAWALFAAGQDAAARAAMQRAVSAAASEGPREELLWQQQRLERAIGDAPRRLADAETLYEQLRRIVEIPSSLALEDAADSKLFEALVRAHRELVDLLRPGGLAELVGPKLRWAEAIEDLTLRHPNARVTWEQAAGAIAAADGWVASAGYGHFPFELRPQTGLVPIGMNPATGLWEFYHLRSAVDEPDPEAARRLEIPRFAADGSLDLGHDSGIVFVLVPGTFGPVGAQDIDPNGAHFDPAARHDEAVIYCRLDPFFIARHELTQGQWRRLHGRADPLAYRSVNPSGYTAHDRVRGRWITERHPVEFVDWASCTALMERHGLALPTEWQWEVACRAGTGTAYFTGQDPESLEGHANVLDAAAAEATWWNGARVAFDDGHVVHAPVGSYSPNAFGLYDMHGNVSELCADPKGSAPEFYTLRGGTHCQQAEEARSAFRLGVDATSKGASTGMRAARRLY